MSLQQVAEGSQRPRERRFTAVAPIMMRASALSSRASMVERWCRCAVKQLLYPLANDRVEFRYVLVLNADPDVEVSCLVCWSEQASSMPADAPTVRTSHIPPGFSAD